MFKNPLNEERLQKLKDDAKDFFTIFGPLYTASYGRAMYASVKQELEEQKGGSAGAWKLTHRDWYSVPRKNLFSGSLFVRKGVGAGNFSDSKQYFVVERQDYGVELYKDEEKYKKKEKPESTIQPAGYKLIVNVAEHYKQDSILTGGLGMTEEQVQALTADMTIDSWALAHPQRTNYIFQMEKGKGGGGCCGGGGSVAPVNEALSAEASAARQPALGTMRECVVRANPRDLKSILGMAFELTCKQLPTKTAKLQGWTDHGTESEMLLDALMEFCIPELRDAMLAEMQGPTLVRLKMWYKCHEVMFTILSEVMNVAWAAVLTAIGGVHKAIEPIIRGGMTEIAKVQTTVEGTIKAAVMDKIVGALATDVTPFIDPLLKALQPPLQESFQNGRSIMSKSIIMAKLPTDSNKRNAMLNGLPRNKLTVARVAEPLSKLGQYLHQLKTANQLSAKIFDEIDADELQREAEKSVLETLDAAIATLEERLDKGPAKETLLDEILLDYDHDSLMAQSIYLKEVIESILTAAFKKIVAPITDPIIGKIDGAIPEAFSKFLSVEQIFDNFVAAMVAQPVEKSISNGSSQPASSPMSAQARSVVSPNPNPNPNPSTGARTVTGQW